ncbi:MAG: hypothetical protein QME14_06955 [Methanobacteriaceae archaeon]|nr:hypothetical protein [Methanobacteriaceae archaeon]
MDKKIIYINSIIIALLAAIANISGLFWKKLYQNDTISITAQMMGQDLITLVIVLPLLLASLYLISRNSLKGRLMWMGIMFYFIYTYASMSFLASYNQLFLVYVAILALSLYTFMGELLTIKIENIRESFSPGNITKITAIFLLLAGLMLAAMWISMIAESLISGLAPASLESYTTLVIQALDLAVVVPASIIAGFLLTKGRLWGYILASIFLIKAALLGTAILSMILFMVLNGVTVALGQVIFFFFLTLVGTIIALAFYNNIQEK